MDGNPNTWESVCICGMKVRHYHICPQCARFREKMDREKIADRLFATWYRPHVPKTEFGQPSAFYMKALRTADTLIAYLTE